VCSPKDFLKSYFLLDNSFSYNFSWAGGALAAGPGAVIGIPLSGDLSTELYDVLV